MRHQNGICNCPRRHQGGIDAAYATAPERHRCGTRAAPGRHRCGAAQQRQRKNRKSQALWAAGVDWVGILSTTPLLRLAVVGESAKKTHISLQETAPPRTVDWVGILSTTVFLWLEAMVGEGWRGLAPTIKTQSTTGFQPSLPNSNHFLQPSKPSPPPGSNQINYLKGAPSRKENPFPMASPPSRWPPPNPDGL